MASFQWQLLSNDLVAPRRVPCLARSQPPQPSRPSRRGCVVRPLALSWREAARDPGVGEYGSASLRGWAGEAGGAGGGARFSGAPVLRREGNAESGRQNTRTRTASAAPHHGAPAEPATLPPGAPAPAAAAALSW